MALKGGCKIHVLLDRMQVSTFGISVQINKSLQLLIQDFLSFINLPPSQYKMSKILVFRQTIHTKSLNIPLRLCCVTA